MAEITNIRCVLLSSPYADADDPEIKECFPNGPKRTIGMVEVTLDNGVTGLAKATSPSSPRWCSRLSSTFAVRR